MTPEEIARETADSSVAVSQTADGFDVTIGGVLISRWRSGSAAEQEAADLRQCLAPIALAAVKRAVTAERESCACEAAKAVSVFADKEQQEYVADAIRDGASGGGWVTVQYVRDAVAAEREACARLAQSHPFGPADMDDGTRAHVAEAIRARGTQ
jgi:hypothetical protein